MADERKPRGWGAFNALARKLVNVPKDAVHKAIAQKKARRRKRRKKRSR